MIHTANGQIRLNRYLLLEKGFEVRWWQKVDKNGIADEDGGYFTTSQKYQLSEGVGMLLRMRDRQVARERREKKPPFNKKEAKIINTLFQHQIPLTTGKVTKYAGFSYNTTKKYLRRLAEKGYVKHVHHGNAVYWWLKEREE